MVLDMPQEKPSAKTDKNLENDFVPLTLRIPRNVHARLKDISEEEYRSLNHQIIMALSYFIDMQEKFGNLPHPEFLKKTLPSGTQAFQTWLKGNSTPPKNRSN